MNPFINQVASKDTIELMARFFDSATNSLKKANYDPRSEEHTSELQSQR